MSIVEVLLIGVALAMDAFALTVANCATYKKSLNRLKEWSMPTAFAVFQFLMPVIGFYIGSIFSSYLATVSKYLTAGIFFLLAIKIVIDNVKEIKEIKAAEAAEKSGFTEARGAANGAGATNGSTTNGAGAAGVVGSNGTANGSTKESGNNGGVFTFWVLILQAVATSIDALAVGVTFSVELSFSVFAAAAIIGGVTFIIVATALLIGKYLGKLLGKYATWLGAVILLALAVKNLADAIA